VTRLGSALSLRRQLRLALTGLLAAWLATPSGWGQAAATASSGPPMSRIDIFAGYGYIAPFNSDIANVKYPPIPLGAVGSVAGYFGNHLGVQVEGNYSPNGPTDNNCVYSAQAGPIVRFHMRLAARRSRVGHRASCAMCGDGE